MKSCKHLRQHQSKHPETGIHSSNRCFIWPPVGKTQWLHRAVGTCAHRPVDSYSPHTMIIDPHFPKCYWALVKEGHPHPLPVNTLFTQSPYNPPSKQEALGHMPEIDTAHWNWDRRHLLDNIIHPGSSTALDNGVEIYTNELLYEEESAGIKEKQNRTL